MLGKPVYLRVWGISLRVMWTRAVRRPSFWWLLLGLPAAAWLLPGQGSVPPLPLAASMAAACVPAAFLTGWITSPERRHLAMTLFPSGAGKAGLILPELLLPVISGSLLSAGLTTLWGAQGTGVPWQLWVLIPFSALTSTSLLVMIERRMPFSGRVVFVAMAMAQALAVPWTAAVPFRLLLVQGYPLWTMQWFSGDGAGLHGDVFLFFGVLEGTGLLLLTLRSLSAPQRQVLS